MQDMMTLVDEHDRVLGPISKLNGHLLLNNTESVQGNGPHSTMMKRSELHRAFSLLLFNSNNELLLQQRAFKKITFPGRWTNTCCSHNAHVPEELEPEPHFLGMRRAAVRRAGFELGIRDLEPGEMRVVSRILYYAESCERFAEHELDYIIFAKKDIDSRFAPNRDEIEEIAWVKYHEFEDFLQEQQKKADLRREANAAASPNTEVDQSVITPWFRLLKEQKLMRWWKTLIDEGRFPDEAHHIENFTITK